MNKYVYWLDQAAGLGNGARRRLIQAFGSPQGVYEAGERYLGMILEEKKKELLISSRRSWDLEGEYEKLERSGSRMVCFLEEDYPQRLREIPDAPFCLYYKGGLPRQEVLSVAVVGARECSEYGEYVAVSLGRFLGEQGVQVISGMARGIDGISQRAAVQAGGSSFAILGCGVDICYPKANRELYGILEKRGGILSPYAPGTQPRPQLFPPRNRIVSGLADAVVVVEARQKSGTLITVDMALEQGRDVYAVPGRLTDRLSDGCNKLLREGAMVFLSPREFLAELRSSFPGKILEDRGGEDEKGERADEKGERAEEGGGGLRGAKERKGEKKKAPEEGGGNRAGRRAGERSGETRRSDRELSGEIRRSDRELSGETRRSGRELSEEEILRTLDLYPRGVEEICERLQGLGCALTDPADILPLLMKLVLSNRIKQVSPGWFSL